jgi:ribosome-binding protein aMBF1 (putative translation factor)
VKVLSSGRVALLGITHRQIRISRRHIPANRNRCKSLPTSVKTLGDLIQIKRYEKKFALCKLAENMGIAHTLIRAWERDASQPNRQQMEQLKKLLEFGSGIDLPNLHK